VAARPQLLVDLVSDRGLHVQAVEARGVRPERAVEVLRLRPRAFEGDVEVGVPVVPKLQDAQERLENRLVLVVAAWRADGQHGVSPLKTMLGVSV